MRKLYFYLLLLLISNEAFSQNYTILGNASSMGGCNCFRLTPDANDQAGAIFQNQTINLHNSFDFTFNIFLGCNNGNDAADGIVFVLTSNPNGLGNTGEGLGYAGGNQPFSFAVEFDTWENGNAGDPSFDHIGIESNGNYNHNVAAPVPALPGSGNIDNCQWYVVRIVWDVNTNTFSVYFNGVLRQQVIIPNMVGTYFGGNPVVNWGWSGATGGGTNDQQVCVLNTSNWVAGVNYQSCSTTMQFSDISTSDLGTIQSWAWNFGDAGTSTLQNPTHTYAANGTYTVTLTVTDIAGCTNTYTHAVTIAPPITLTPSFTMPPCNGGLNGSIGVTPANGFGVSAGYGGYTYSWNGGVNTDQTYLGAPAGTYAVTVTDGVCTTTGSYTLNQPPALTASTSHTDANCGGNNGTATITLSGGTTPYTTVNWGTGGICNPSPNTCTVSGLMWGVYVADFHDANGCSSALQYRETVADLPCGYSLTSSSTNVSCWNGNNGTATVTPSGGGFPWTTTWTPGGTGNTITGLIAGTYNYSTNNGGGGQTFTGSVVITQPAAIVASIVTIDMSCANTNDGQAVASVTSGGIAPFTYVWSRGTANGATVTGLSPGAISVVITDGTGCSATASGNITGPPLLTLSITPINDSCYQSNTGSATANVSGGNPPYLFYWSNISTAQTNLSLGAGTYTVTVTDDKGCSITGTTTLTQPAPFTHTLTHTNVACFGNSTGTITVTPTGGLGTLTYTWNPATATGNNPTNLAAGQYNLTLSDANNCQILDSVVVTQPPSALAVTTSHTDVTCNGANDGTLTITVGGGTPLYNYQSVTFPAGTMTIPGLPDSTYSGNVTDANGCSVAVSETITEPTVLTVTGIPTHVGCNGGSTGSIDITASGGISPYTYLWCDGTSIEDRTNIGAMCCSVTVTDDNGCTAVLNICVTEPPALTVAEAHTNILCNGDSTGSIDVTAAGGTTAYSYLWNDGITTEDRTNIPVACYSVVVTDANGCSASVSACLTEPAPLTVSETHFNILCNGNSTGYIDLACFGGAGGYMFLWSTGATTEDVANLPGGCYTVTVTDNNGCSTSVSACITEPAALNVTTSHTDATCNGASDGTVTVTITGGTPSYDYLGTQVPAGTTVISNLPAGIYAGNVTDSNGCVVAVSETITQPPAPVMPVTVVAAPCFGGNGTATANPVGGGTYTYTWTVVGSGSTQTVSAPAGNYRVTATDASSCRQTASFNINQPADITVAETHTDLRCFGDADGTITLTPSGGNGGPYTYSWTPNVSSSNFASLLTAGNYDIIVTDTATCTKSITITLTQPAQPLSVSILPDNVSCFGMNNGSITITASGGTPNYTYTWNPNVSNTNSATGLGPNTYSILVTDSNGCNLNPMVTITEPNQPLTLVGTSTNLTCFQSADGTASVIASGGTAPYVYAWTPSGGSNPTATGLAAGNYNVLVTDFNGCLANQPFIITEPAVLATTETHQNILCFGNTNGSIDINVTGGTLPYSYSWNPSVSNTDTAGNLGAATYAIVVTDSNLCSTTQVVTITEPAVLDLTATPTDVLCNGGSTGIITPAATGGTLTYNFTATDGTNNFTPANGQFLNLPQGTYTVYVTDQNGCADSTSTTVNEPPVLTDVLDAYPTLCFNTSDGRIVVSAIGGVPSYTFNLSGGGSNTTGIFDGLPAGTYSVTVTDANGCTVSDSGTITEPVAVLVTVSPNPIEVKLGDDLQITTTTNQTGVLTYNWSPAFGLSCDDCANPVFSGVYSQPYAVVVTNEFGCTGTSGFTVTVIPNYDVFIPNAFTPNGDGANDYWQLFGNMAAIKQLQVMVFNRIGEKVFEGNDIHYKWDGTYKGEKAPPGVYVYVAKFVWLNNHSDADYTGSITLLR